MPGSKSRTRARGERRPSRAQREAELVSAAIEAAPSDVTDVCVVGGGAAGLVAAIVAAEEGASVVVLEAELECGRSILATGNGRCNFSTVRLDPQRYNDPEFVRATFGQRPLDDVLGFFRDCGLRWSLEDDRLYPLSRQAASVRNVLLARARRAGLRLACGRRLVALEPRDDGWRLRFEARWDAGRRGELRAQTVVLATGGTNSVGGGALTDDLGLERRPLSPALCPVACEDSPLSLLDGRRAQVDLSLVRDDDLLPCWHERGELLFRDYGISGIVTFDLSRRARPGDWALVDLVPDHGVSELRQIVGMDPEPGCLDGVLDPEVARLLERLARERWDPGAPQLGPAPRDDDVDWLVHLTKQLPLRITGLVAQKGAQVCQGGLQNRQFDPQSLRCETYPSLLACGEALDVDGDCGGLNLSWAWKSGLVAGRSAAEAARKAG